MSVETAKFIVQRGADQFMCRGDELIDKLQSGDLMIVQHDNEDEASKWEVQGSPSAPGFPDTFEVKAEHTDGNTNFWFDVGDIIRLQPYFLEPGTTLQDYIDAYDVETIIESSVSTYLTLYTGAMYTPQWVEYTTRQTVMSLMPVVVKTKWTNKNDPTDVHTFTTALTISNNR